MRHSELVATIAAYTAHLAHLDRFVQIDADHVAVITVNLYTNRLTESPTPAAVMDVFQKHVSVDGDETFTEWESTELELLPSATLARVAQMKQTLELWNKNELDDLPTTDAADPTLQVRRQRNRVRRYHRR